MAVALTQKKMVSQRNSYGKRAHSQTYYGDNGENKRIILVMIGTHLPLNKRILYVGIYAPEERLEV